MADPKTVLEFAKKNEVKMFDLRFTDLPGLQHHVSYPIDQLSEGSFEEGFGIDGSCIRGWAAINESDMLLIPDPDHRIHGSVRRNPDAGDDRATSSTRSPSSTTTAIRAGSPRRPNCI